MDEASKKYNTFTVRNLGYFEHKHILFGLCNAPPTFQRLMQNCLGELNLMFCSIYLDHVMVFLKTEKEHLKCLHIVFDCFLEHSLRPKYTKC